MRRENTPALLIIKTLCKSKRSVVVNLGKEATLNLLIVQHTALRMKNVDDVDYGS